MIKQQFEVTEGQKKEVAWGEIYLRLVAYGTGRHSLSVEVARDLAQESIRQCIEKDRVNFDRSKYNSLLDSLGSTINGLVVNLRRRKGYKNERLTSDGELPQSPSTTVSAEERVITGDLLSLAIEELQELVKGDELMKKIVHQIICEGCDTAAEQAEALGVPIRDVYKARERLAPHRAALKAALGDK